MNANFEKNLQLRNKRLEDTLLSIEQLVDDRFDPDCNDFQKQYRINCFADEVIEQLISQNAFAIPDEFEDGEWMAVHPYSATFSKSNISIYASALLRNGANGYDLHLFTVDYSPRSEVEEVTLKDFQQLEKKAFNFYKFSIDGKLPKSMSVNHLAYNASQNIYLNKSSINQIRTWVLTNKLYSGMSKSARNTDSTLGFEQSAKIIDLEDLDGMLGGDLEIEQSFEQINGLPCIEVGNNISQDYSCILTVIPGSILAQLYHLHGTAIIQANVRAYLGANKINKAIKETAISKPERFLAYNNGLAIAAKSAEVKNGKLMALHGFQIINGGQTTATLFHAWLSAKTSKNPEVRNEQLNQLLKVKLPAKIIVAAPKLTESERQELQEQISEAANSQNTIFSSDLSANSPFHVEFEKICRKLLTTDDQRWYYERSRSQYKAELEKLKGNKVAKNRFVTTFPKSKLIHKTDIAMSTLAWNYYPQDCAKGKEHAFTVFNQKFKDLASTLNDVEVRKYVCRWIIFSELETFIKKQKIMRGSNPRVPVIYSISLFAKKFNNDFLWDYLWQNQHISNELKMALSQLVLRVESIIRKNMGTVMIAMWGRQAACLKTLEEDFSFDGLNFDDVPELRHK